MTLAVLNINDAGIQLAIDGELIRTSPGFAVLDNQRLMTGEEASQNARLLPRWTNNRYWSQLTTNPLPNQTDQIRHHADLALAHLEDLWLPYRNTVEAVILIVPGYYTPENLGLLLGLAQEADMPVSGVVDQSVLVASRAPLRSVILHLDIHLHSITLTRISNSGTLIRQAVKTVIETGLFTLWDRWANVIANQFIQATRFDPMHDASSEQQMFDRLPGWIKEFDDQGMQPFELDAGKSLQSVAVSSESLLKACAPLYPQIVQMIRQEMPAGVPTSLLLSHWFKGFPGLKDSLNLINNLEIIDLGEAKSIESAIEHCDEIINSTGNVSHILRLSAGEVAESVVTNAPGHPTHLLWTHQATPIGRSFKLAEDMAHGPLGKAENPVCTLYPRNNQMLIDCHRLGSIMINGQAASGLTTPLNNGDILTIGEHKLTLISVVQDG